MRKLAITINKGGVGKTTLRKSIAAAATAAGLNVLVLDMDTQQNAAKWAKRRAKGKPLPLRYEALSL
jgi:chromosome partitioning protein